MTKSLEDRMAAEKAKQDKSKARVVEMRRKLKAKDEKERFRGEREIIAVIEALEQPAVKRLWEVLLTANPDSEQIALISRVLGAPEGDNAPAEARPVAVKQGAGREVVDA